MIFNRKMFLYLFGLVVIYAFWNGRDIILGPQVTIYPPSVDVTAPNPITIKGVVKNASFISLNGRQIFVDEEGLFSEEVVESPGLNTIELYVRDRFGKEKREFVKLYN